MEISITGSGDKFEEVIAELESDLTLLKGLVREKSGGDVAGQPTGEPVGKCKCGHFAGEHYNGMPCMFRGCPCVLFRPRNDGAPAAPQSAPREVFNLLDSIIRDTSRTDGREGMPHVETMARQVKALLVKQEPTRSVLYWEPEGGDSWIEEYLGKIKNTGGAFAHIVSGRDGRRFWVAMHDGKLRYCTLPEPVERPGVGIASAGVKENCELGEARSIIRDAVDTLRRALKKSEPEAEDYKKVSALLERVDMLGIDWGKA